MSFFPYFVRVIGSRLYNSPASGITDKVLWRFLGGYFEWVVLKLVDRFFSVLLLFTGNKKLCYFSKDPWLISFFLTLIELSLCTTAVHKKILYFWIMTFILHNNWCATPFKIDIWRVNAKMITVIISDTFGKCLYWSFSVREYGKFCDIFTVLNLTGPLENVFETFHAFFFAWSVMWEWVKQMMTCHESSKNLFTY